MTRRKRVRLRKARNRIARCYAFLYAPHYPALEGRRILRGWAYWSVIALDRVNRGATEARIRAAYAAEDRDMRGAEGFLFDPVRVGTPAGPSVSFEW
jgi:hypothetical protein